MKKLAVGIAVMALVFGVGTVSVLAAESGRGRYFIDKDNDGVCDYAHGACSFVDEDGDGVCDYAHSACSFVDEDNDGVCDNCNDSICRKAERDKGCGNRENRGHHSSGHGHRSGSGKRSYGRHH